MTINDMDKFTSSLWDWKFLDNCFQGTRIKVSDIDGIVERKGQFLVIECKNPNVPIPVGQKIMFDNMAKTGFFTVIVVWGEKNKPEKMKILCKNKNGLFVEKDYEEIDEEKLKKTVGAWYATVNKNN
jgi:hypothetical protein